jgi:hypothetical protein
MSPLTIIVAPVQATWVILCSMCEPVLFVSGGAAEKAAKRRALALAKTGTACSIVVHDRTGGIAGSHHYPASLIWSLNNED